MFPFDPPESFRKPKVFWCFQGGQKGTLRRKGLNEELSIDPSLEFCDHNYCENFAKIQKNFMLSPCFDNIWESRIYDIYA